MSTKLVAVSTVFLLRAVLVESCKNIRKQKPK